MMKHILVLLLVIGVAAAKPAAESFDFDEEFIQGLVRENGEDSYHGPTTRFNQRPTTRPQGPSTSRPKDFSLFAKFFYYLKHISIGNVKPDEHPDKKYEKPGKKLVKKLLRVREAVIEALDPIRTIIGFLIEDFKEMSRRVVKAVRKNDIDEAKHVVGEYFIALNRRAVALVFHAHEMGLFREIGNKNKNANDMNDFKDALSKQADEAKGVAEWILENFSEFRVSDGRPDAPYVKLGVKIVKAYIEAFKLSMKFGKMNAKFYIDMISDIVRLALVKRDHDAAIQRAGAGVLSMVRRDTKIAVAVHRLYSRKQCHGPGKHDELD